MMQPHPGQPSSRGSHPGGAAQGSPVATPVPSGFVGRYQILEKIGEGGMGSLYLARDPAIDRLVAIKLLRRGFDTDALRERFAREARAAGRLRHPHIVTIFDVGEHDGDPFIAMEFLAGETLGELVRHGAGLSLSRRLKLIEELCDGLAYAHRAGLVHRDIKPANLMVDAEGVLKILDFGIVRVGDSGMTQAGVLVGTINYMSPEQVLGTGVDHRSDIFAVGLVAYELLSGRQAFVGTMNDGLLRRIPNVEIEPLASVVAGLDAEVITIIEQALQKEPADRYQDLARMRNDLARVRVRIEAEEERAALAGSSDSPETAVIASQDTAPGVLIEAPPGSGAGLLADAERALAAGNYRYALTVAGRAAAVNPHDRSPSGIVARAEAALLERGRTYDPAFAPVPRSGPGAPAAALPAPSSQGGTASTQRANYVAVGVALTALLVAGFAVWSQVGSTDRQGDLRSSANPAAPAAEQPAAAAVQPPPVTPAGPPKEPPSTTTEQPADTTATMNAVSREAERSTARPPAPDPRREARGNAPAATGRQATDSAGRGRTRKPDEQPKPGTGNPAADRSAAAVPAVPVTAPVTSPGTLPGTEGPRPAPPQPPPAAPPAPKAAPPGNTAEQKAAAPVRDPRAEAEAAVRQVLQRYKAGWESLNFDALARVWVMPDARGTRDGIADLREYAMNMEIRSIEIAADARSATATCFVTHRFEPRVGSRQTSSRLTTFTIEKRGDNWMITRQR